MKAAADQTLKEHSKEIADALFESLRNGNASCAKLLIALAEGQIDCEDEAEVQLYYGFAERLAAEQEWQGQMDEEALGTGFGLRKRGSDAAARFHLPARAREGESGK